MHFESGNIYHVYNRGNERQTIFFSRENYLFFLSKVRSEWLPLCDVLAYCLMPNHFHFLLLPNDKACRHIVLKGKETHMQELSKRIGKTLSSYTQAINIEQKRTGNLFQKKTKAKLISSDGKHLLSCVSYIHANPVAANLCTRDDDWEYSSSKDYSGIRNGTLCNKTFVYSKTGLSELYFRGSGGINFTKQEIETFY